MHPDIRLTEYYYSDLFHNIRLDTDFKKRRTYGQMCSKLFISRGRKPTTFKLLKAGIGKISIRYIPNLKCLSESVRENSPCCRSCWCCSIWPAWAGSGCRWQYPTGSRPHFAAGSPPCRTIGQSSFGKASSLPKNRSIKLRSGLLKYIRSIKLRHGLLLPTQSLAASCKPQL